MKRHIINIICILAILIGIIAAVLVGKWTAIMVDNHLVAAVILIIALFAIAVIVTIAALNIRFLDDSNDNLNDEV